MKKRALLVGGAVLLLVVILAGNRGTVSNWLEGFVLGSLDTAYPLDFGPLQELDSRWTASAPTLDGVLSEGEWASAAFVKIDGADKIRPGVASGDSDTIGQRETRGVIPYSSNHATFHVMNDAMSVYVAVDVTDDVLDFGVGTGDIARRDGVEIRVNRDLGRPAGGSNQPGDLVIVLGDGSRSVAPGPDAVAFAGAVKPDCSGYVVEIRWDSSHLPKMIGFDVAVNDSDDPAVDRRHAQYYWNGTRDDGWRNEREWGTVRLAREPAQADSSPGNR